MVGAGANGPAINKHRWAVEARQAHNATWHVFIAATNSHQTVKAFTTGGGFDGVGNHFPGHERILHAFRTIGDAVGYSDRVEDKAFNTGFIGALPPLPRPPAPLPLAWSHPPPGP